MVRLPTAGLIIDSVLRQRSASLCAHIIGCNRNSSRQSAFQQPATTYTNICETATVRATLKVSSTSSIGNYLNPTLNRCYSTMTTRPSVYLTRPDFEEHSVTALRDECRVTYWEEDEPIPHDQLIRYVDGKDAIFCTLNDKIDVKVLDAAGPNLKVIGTMSVGYDHIDLEECKKRGIRVGYTPDVLTDATADLAITLLLTTSRRIIEANYEAHTGGWKAWSPFWMCGVSLKNATVGFVGFGRIAQEVAKRIVPFKPKRIIFTNRSNGRDAEAKEIGAERVSLNEVLVCSDFVILLCALTPETCCLINTNTLSVMKRTAILINVSRGGVVDQDALFEALRTNTIRAAGLDVTTPEPLPLDSPLLRLRNCIVLPHIGSADIVTRQEMCRITVSNILAGLKGEEMLSEL